MRNILNMAHRGFTRAFPDNTLEAFAAAIRIGVDGIELDIHETFDHRFVVFHDSRLLGKDISHLSFSDIREVKLEGKYIIPTLEEALELCRGKVKLVIEMKSVASMASLIEVIRRRSDTTNVFLTSFNGELILQESRLAPEIHRGVIIAFPVEDPVALIKSTESNILLPIFPLVTSEIVDEIHKHNFSIVVWGCNNTKEIQCALRMDIDGIISDFPDIVAKKLIQ